MTKTVVVTGFGPFGPWETNPSTEVVKNLSKLGLPEVNDANLVTDLMSVEYNEVDTKVHNYWKEHCPDLIIHVGVHPVKKTIKFEQQSFGDGYCRGDVAEKLPDNGMAPNCTVHGAELRSGINCLDLAERVTGATREKHPGLTIMASEDPGRYLCGFSFYISLCHDKSKALFVHIPEFDEDATLEAITEKKLNIPDTAQSVVCEVEKPKKILTDAERQRMEKIETMKCKSSTKGHDIQQADIRFLHVEATGNAQGKFVLVDKKWTVSRCVDTTIRHFALVNTGSDAWAKKYQLYKDGQREPLSPSEEIGKLIDFNKNNVSYVQLKLDQ
ncbi:unnamed protein product, partial [Mesorhabditis spiculigera]